MDNSGLIKIKQSHKKDCRNAFYKKSDDWDSQFYIQTKLVSIVYREGNGFVGTDQGEGNRFEINSRNLFELNQKDRQFLQSKPNHLWIRGHFNYDYQFEQANLQSIRIYRDNKPVCGGFPKNAQKTFQSVIDTYD
jgi:hypothetical protein